MFRRSHLLKNGKQVEIIRCSEADIPYIKSLKNIMDEEVQNIAHMGTYKTTKMYFFKKLTATDGYENLPISYGISSSKTFFLLAVIDNEIAAYIVAMGMWRNEEDLGRKNLWLFDIEVISKYRRLGVASLLIESLKECGAENGYENIYSESRLNSSWNSDNTAGINLFLKTRAIELHNIDFMKAVMFSEEEQYEELQIADDEAIDESSRFHLEMRAKSYKWRI